MRPMIIGMAPGATPGPVLGGRAGDRLAELAGCTQLELRRRFRLRNTLATFPGKDGKGDSFPLAEARQAARRMRLRGIVVVLGRVNAEAHGVGKLPPFEWLWRSRSCSVAWMPHPSGVNLWWNDSANVARARAFMRELMEMGGGT